MCYYFKLLVLKKLWLQLAISALVFTQTITIPIFLWKHNIYLSLIFRQGVIINKSDGTLTIMTEKHDSLKASATDNLSDGELNVKDEVNLTVLTVSTIIRSFFYTLNLSLHLITLHNIHVLCIEGERHEEGCPTQKAARGLCDL